jgi:hypothetical protein
VKYPDFVICKGGPGLFEDIILAVIEVKKAANDPGGYAQLADYLQTAGLKPHVSPLRGFLIQGTDVSVYELHPNLDVLEVGTVTIVEPPTVLSFLTLMGDLAERYR